MQRDRPAEMRTNHFAQVKRGGRGWGPLLILGMLSFLCQYLYRLTDSHRGGNELIIVHVRLWKHFICHFHPKVVEESKILTKSPTLPRIRRYGSDSESFF